MLSSPFVIPESYVYISMDSMDHDCHNELAVNFAEQAVCLTGIGFMDTKNGLYLFK